MYKKRVLFVDDEINVLNGLRRMLHAMRSDWDMEFVLSGEDALPRMDEAPFDIVVSDMRMPGMDGAEFLARVREKHPETIRIILSGFANPQAILRSVGPTHQFLAKPCDPQKLRSTIERSLRLRGVLSSAHLTKLVSKLTTVPSVPSLYLRVVEELKTPDCSVARVGELVSQDVAMSASILKIVNSAYFGLSTPCQTAGRAVTMLGIDIVTSLVLGVNIFAAFEGAHIRGFSLDELWRRSMCTALVARRLAAEEQLGKQLAESAFLAGMMHRLGQLVLAANLRLEYTEVLARAAQGQRLAEAERDVLGAPHCEVGAYLLGLWAMLDPVIEAVADQDSPLTDPLDLATPRGLLRLALGLIRHAQGGDRDPLTGELDAIGAMDRFGAWMNLVSDVQSEQVAT